jgi:hypothetical protein
MGRAAAGMRCTKAALPHSRGGLLSSRHAGTPLTQTTRLRRPPPVRARARRASLRQRPPTTRHRHLRRRTRRRAQHGPRRAERGRPGEPGLACWGGRGRGEKSLALALWFPSSSSSSSVLVPHPVPAARCVPLMQVRLAGGRFAQRRRVGARQGSAAAEPRRRAGGRAERSVAAVPLRRGHRSANQPSIRAFHPSLFRTAMTRPIALLKPEGDIVQSPALVEKTSYRCPYGPIKPT